jgi:TrmH family RNA methyltransferase
VARRLGGFVVILVGPRDGANIGAAARAMKNCGITELRIVGGRRLGARARRAAVHSEDVLAAARRFPTLAEAAADAAWIVGFTARARRFGSKLESWDARVAESLRGRGRGGKVALVFGREDSGLSDAEVRHCAALFRLPASPARPVYNLAQAVLLVCYAIEFGAQGPEPARGGGADAPKQQIDGLLAEFARVLAALEYPAARRPHDRTSRILARIQSQLSRARLDEADVAMWRGILARIKA